MPLLAFALPFLLFISLPSRLWNFDGVACAAALELGNPLFLFHSNHMLYGFLGSLFWKLFPLSVMPRALPTLQLFTSLLSAGGLAVLFLIVKNLMGSAKAALLLVLCLSVTAVVWVWSVEAQVYALGFLGISGATLLLLQTEGPKKWLWIGAAHAGAILGHVVHVLWLVPALYWLWKEGPRARYKNLARYFTTLAVVTLLPYVLVIGLIIVPRQMNDRWLLKWIMGSAALNATSAFEWHSAGWRGPFEWLATTLRMFWGSFWPYQTTVPLWCWGLTAVSAAVLAVLLGAAVRRRTPMRTFCLLWLAVYGVFFWTWEPKTECYRMTDLIPIGLLLAMGAGAFPRKRTAGILLGVLFLSLFPLNLRTRIHPMHDDRRNLLYQETLRLGQATPENSLYLTVGGTPWIYLLYFLGRSGWNLHSFARDPNRLQSEIRRHLSRGPVYLRSDAAATGLVMPLPRKAIPLGDSLPWLQLQ